MKKHLTGPEQARKMSESIEDTRLPKTQGNAGIFTPSKKSLQSDNLPKVGSEKTYREITSSSVIQLPRNTVKPVNGRLFCRATNPEERITESGIILPEKPLDEDPNAYMNKDRTQKDRKRFWVIDIADDIPFKIERGDEVYPFWIDEALGYNSQMIRDFGNQSMDYFVFHYTELAGISMLKHEKIKD